MPFYSAKNSSARIITKAVMNMKILHQKVPYWLLVQLAKTKNQFRIEVENSYDPIPDKPIIFAANHTNCYDFPITATAVGRHVYVLVGNQRLGFLDRFFFSLNGVIYADRLDKEDTRAVKGGIIGVLRKGHAVCWYPEGTWNMTPNLLMLPMKWGIIDVAGQADAQIIPVALVYDREEMICRVRFGAPMAGDALDDKRQAIDALRDTLASLRWELINRTPVLKGQADRVKLRDNVFCAVDEYPPLEPEYEKQCVYRPFEKVEIVPSDLIPCRANAFLFNKRLSGGNS